MVSRSSETNISGMAEKLKVLKNASVPTAIFLGAKAGALFRSQHLYSQLSKINASHRKRLRLSEKFSQSYRTLTSNFSEDEIQRILASRELLEEIRPDVPELCVAHLMKQGVFNFILSTSVHQEFEQAFKLMDMERGRDFSMAWPKKYATVPSIITNKSGLFTYYKLFGDIHDGCTIKDRLNYMHGYKDLERIADDLRTMNMVIIGLDPVWDRDIVPALFPRSATTWYVNDEMPSNDSILYEHLVKYGAELIQDSDGRYEKFIKKLCVYMTGNVPTNRMLDMLKEIGNGVNQQTASEFNNAMWSHPERGRFQKGFVNREKEFQLVENTFNALLDSKSVPATPLIDFFGINGIGKTRMLRQIEYICIKRNITYIWLDVSMDKSRFVDSISRQMQKHINSNEQITSDANKSFYTSSLQAIKTLLDKKPPVVVLLDSIDITDRSQFDWIETMTQTLIENPALCVVFASKQKISFERDWSMGRKLNPFQLRPLDQTSSELYIKHAGSKISGEVQKLIFEWTRGYPLAMDVMARAITTKSFDLVKDEDQRSLIDVIIKRVIDKGILGKVKREKFIWYKKSLSLLAVPRRFNLVIIQDLFEQFGSSLISDSSSKLAYMVLPQELNVNTNVLSWDLQKAGFTIDQTVRNILLLQRRIEQPKLFYEIHAFLAQKNEELADVVVGTDRVRYLREYLYHSIHSVDAHALPTIIEQTLQKIAQNSAEEVIQFSEEFNHDEELREALKSNVSLIDIFIKEHVSGEW